MDGHQLDVSKILQLNENIWNILMIERLPWRVKKWNTGLRLIVPKARREGCC